MLNRGKVDVWVVRLDGPGEWPPPTPAEAERAGRFATEALRQRHLRSHAALRAILRRYTTAPVPDFALAEHGKPYLPAVPDLKFNLTHSHQLALVAVAREMEVGVDVERLRPLPECLAIAERFFPPADAAALAEVPADRREHEFFRRWTRIEALLKARGTGLYGIGSEPAGDWTVEPVDTGDEYTAAVAAAGAAVRVEVHAFAG
jgi:4'-phosphopantetheinyl transferase